MGSREADRRYYEANRDAILARRRARSEQRKEWDRRYYAANKDKVSERNRMWAAINTDSARFIKQRWTENNRDSIAAKRRRWKEKNRNKLNAKEARRRAARNNACPPWADMDAISKFYENCPAGYEVDHFVPLRGVLPCGARVSGLHVVENLRYLPARANHVRGNRMTADEVEEACRGN